MSQPDPARVHDAMVFAFEQLETRSDLDEGDVREMLFKKGYAPEVIEMALANLPKLPPRLKPRPLTAPPRPVASPPKPAPKPDMEPLPDIAPAPSTPAPAAPQPSPAPSGPPATEIRSADPWSLPDIYPGPAPAQAPAPAPQASPAPVVPAAPLPTPAPKPAMAPLPEDKPKPAMAPLTEGKAKPAMAPLTERGADGASPGLKTGPLAAGKKAPGSAKRGRPTQGVWLFAAGAGFILLALIFAFSCGRTLPEGQPGPAPENAPAAPVEPAR